MSLGAESIHETVVKGCNCETVAKQFITRAVSFIHK